MSLTNTIKGLGKQVLRVDLVRHWVTVARFQYLSRRADGVRTLSESEGVAKNTVMHNLKALMSTADISITRSRFLVWPLAVIETLSTDSKILVIGPRSEGELLHLVGFGFRPANVRGLDLISYSPWIDLGDMHAMPYADNSWDATILGWVIAYSNTPEKAAEEVVRVTRNGGIVAVGVEYNPRTNEDILQQHGYIAGGEKRILSVEEILKFFGHHVDQVYFSHDVRPDRRDKVGALAVVFSIKK